MDNKQQSNNMCGNEQFIWGVKCSTDKSSEEPNFLTLNAIEIWFNTETKDYSLHIECPYDLTSVEYADYLLDLCCKFQKYLIDIKKTNVPLPACDYIRDRTGLSFVTKTIEELFINFALYSLGFYMLCKLDLSIFNK